MNEELRSATEELETSREELQSINEELTTVNQELKGKVDELSHANGDLQNLMAATAIATVFLDRDLRITLLHAVGGRAVQPDPDRRRPAAQRPRRAGSTTRSSTPTPRARAADAWCRSSARCASASAGCWRACCPYRSGEDRISGVVLTFVDITERRRVTEALRDSEALFRTIVTQAAAGVAHIDLDGRITLANARFALIAGRTPEALIGTSAFALVHPDDRAEQPSRRSAAWPATARRSRWRMRYLRADGTPVWVSASVTPVLDPDGPADRGDRHRARRQRPPPRRAGAARVGGAAAPDRRQRARVRHPHDGPEAAHHRLEQRRRGPHRLHRRRGRWAKAPTSSSPRKTASPARRSARRRRRSPRAAPPTSAGTGGRTARASGAAA